MTLLLRIVFATALVAVSVPPALRAQSLADAAKNAEDARAKAKEEQGKLGDKTSTTKVYTNRHLALLAA